MKNDKENILEKVRKLFALANDSGASEGEIENALKMAQRLMMKHNIDQGEIVISPLDIDITSIENSFKMGEKTTWLWELLDILGRSHNCRIRRAGRVGCYFYEVIGTNEDRKMVKELFDFSVVLIRNLAKKRLSEKVKSCDYKFSRQNYRTSYIDGFLQGLQIKLNKDKKEFLKLEEAETYSLMVVKKDAIIDGWIKENQKPAKVQGERKERPIDLDALRLGFVDGKEESINKQLH